MNFQVRSIPLPRKNVFIDDLCNEPNYMFVSRGGIPIYKLDEIHPEKWNRGYTD